MFSKALEFARYSHRKQRRKYSGLPYIMHCEEVAGILIMDHADIDDVIIGILHDTVEDCDVRITEIQGIFNDYIANGVFYLTDVYTHKNFPDMNRAKRKQLEAERLHKIPARFQRIKCADIISNTNGLFQFWSDEVTCHDLEFAKIYVPEIIATMSGFDKDQRLFRIASDLIEKAWRYINAV